MLCEEQVFVFGQEVDDFNTLNKNTIWTVATAVLQEVYRQLQTEKARNDELGAKLQNVLDRLQAFETVGG